MRVKETGAKKDGRVVRKAERMRMARMAEGRLEGARLISYRWQPHLCDHVGFVTS